MSNTAAAAQTPLNSNRSPIHGNAGALRVAVVGVSSPQATVFKDWLQLAGHRCQCSTYRDALVHGFDKGSIDVILLDWGVQRMSGIDLLRRIRESSCGSLPVLLVAEHYREQDVVSALRQGADDYVVKPIRRFELLARLEAVARRGNHQVAPILSIEAGTIRVDYQTRTVARDGRPLKLTPKDFELCALFLRNVGRVLPRAYLLDHVWGPRAATIVSRTLDTHIARLRRGVGLTPENGWRLVAVYSTGYRLDRLHGHGGALVAEALPYRSVGGAPPAAQSKVVSDTAVRAWPTALRPAASRPEQLPQV